METIGCLGQIMICAGTLVTLSLVERFVGTAFANGLSVGVLICIAVGFWLGGKDEAA